MTTRARQLLPALALLALLAGAQPAHAFRTGGSAWPGRPATISYWNGTSYKSELRSAVRAWNASGARLRFVAAPRSSAKVSIGYEPGPAPPRGFASGFASIGHQFVNHVSLSRGSGGSVMAGVITHELGHVLGLDHEQRRCATMNAVLWSLCGSGGPCSLLLADDVRGALSRYGGSARPRPTTLCAPAPRGAKLTPAAGAFAVQLSATLPKRRNVSGYVERHQVGGKCPSKPKGPVFSATAKGGEQISTQINADGDPLKLVGKTLCLRLWTQTDGQRLSVHPATVRYVYTDQRVPAPASLTASASSFAVELSWPALRHNDLASFELAWAAGATCPSSPAAVNAEHQAQAQPTATRTSVQTSDTGPVCFAIWSRDRYGRLSTMSATTTLTLTAPPAPAPPPPPVPQPQAPFAAISPGSAIGAIADATNTIAFSDASTDDGQIVARAWDFGDPASGAANVSSAAAPSHTFAAVGSYTVSLTVTDNDGLTSSAYASVDIG